MALGLKVACSLHLAAFVCCLLQTVAFLSKTAAYRSHTAKYAGYTSTHPLLMGVAGPEYLLDIVQQKEYEIEQLKKIHRDPLDTLRLRLSYISTQTNKRFSARVKRKDPDDPLRVVIDLKRTSPSLTGRPERISDFDTAGTLVKELTACGADSFFVSTDSYSYGGSILDLETSAQTIKQMRKLAEQQARTRSSSSTQTIDEKMAAMAQIDDRSMPTVNAATPPPPSSSSSSSPPVSTLIGINETFPAIVMKDIIIDPIQIALAAEKGADAVLLIAPILGPNLEYMLNFCTIIGIEGIVEVHTPEEVSVALQCGAHCLVVNNRDRTDGKYYKNQCIGIMGDMPPHVVKLATGGISSLAQAEDILVAGFDGIVVGRWPAGYTKPRPNGGQEQGQLQDSSSGGEVEDKGGSIRKLLSDIHGIGLGYF